MYEICSKESVEAYKKWVIGKGYDVRKFIAECYWGGDNISSESEYELIKRELEKLSKI